MNVTTRTDLKISHVVVCPPLRYTHYKRTHTFLHKHYVGKIKIKVSVLFSFLKKSNICNLRFNVKRHKYTSTRHLYHTKCIKNKKASML